MNVIIDIDLNDYNPKSEVITRKASKTIIELNNKILFLKSAKGDYKLIGGGIEEGEDPLKCLKREVIEEAGYNLIENTIEEIGIILEKRKDKYSEKIWFLETYLYKCDVDLKSKQELKLTSNEKKKGMQLVSEDIDIALEENRKHINDNPWVYREIKTLEYYKENKCYDK